MGLGEKRDTAEGDEIIRIKIKVRMPREMYQAIRRMAASRGMSTNAWLCNAAADQLAAALKTVPFKRV